MILLFFERIVEDHKVGTATEDLVASLKAAYTETLEPYHGWMVQQLFGVSINLSIYYQFNKKFLNGFLLSCKSRDINNNTVPSCLNINIIIIALSAVITYDAQSFTTLASVSRWRDRQRRSYPT